MHMRKTRTEARLKFFAFFQSSAEGQENEMLIRDRNRIVTLASPVRLSIVHTLEGIGPCSVATLARVLGVAPDSLYYHLRLLERRGLITKSAEIVDVRGN